ncbi:MAG: hypothetical protein QNJ55_06905 [Xenococcus sp. MO_188.B8]|nr:hypothetical protein [Xenococcus sp. MO_188.B8]
MENKPLLTQEKKISIREIESRIKGKILTNVENQNISGATINIEVQII